MAHNMQPHKLDGEIIKILDQQLDSLSALSTNSDKEALQVMALRSLAILVKGLYRSKRNE